MADITLTTSLRNAVELLVNGIISAVGDGSTKQMKLYSVTPGTWVATECSLADSNNPPPPSEYTRVRNNQVSFPVRTAGTAAQIHADAAAIVAFLRQYHVTSISCPDIAPQVDPANDNAIAFTISDPT